MKFTSFRAISIPEKNGLAGLDVELIESCTDNGGGEPAFMNFLKQ